MTGFLSRPGGRRRDRHGRRGTPSRPIVERLEGRDLPASVGLAAPPAAPQVLSPQDVDILLERAARASASEDAIIAVVDRNGTVLGVRVEAGVSSAITGSPETLVFAVDGALAEARTGAFFANNAAPLTSRTIQQISQTPMAQREIEANPNIDDPDSPLRGPGFVAPIGKKGHFPARVMFTPQVDLFAIEHTNRDSVTSPGADRIRGTEDDITLRGRFNVDPAFVPTGKEIPAPESYGFISGLLPDAQSRGIGTLPGGIPIFKNAQVVGGIGVFFPGTTGFATEANSNLNDAGFFDPAKPDRALEAEYIAFVAAGGSRTAGVSFNTPAKNRALGLPTFPDGETFDLPSGRIDLVGISLDIFGGHGRQGPRNLVDSGRGLGLGDPASGLPNLPVDRSGSRALGGEAVPEGWLVLPHDSADGTLTAADVTAMIERGVAEANRVRAAIRLPLDSTARMVFAVTDTTGEVLGVFRMTDATFFSIDVAVAKARNVSYYADPAQLQPIDKLPGIPPGVAMTNRTFRYLAEPRFPEGIDTYPPGPFSILNETDVRTVGAPLPASAFQTPQGFDAFNPQSNFHNPFHVANQNGIVFFPGSAPLYKDIDGDGVRELVGGLGVSGDGVDQDDDVTFQAGIDFQPPFHVRRADQVFVRGVRLPYQKFNRQPHVPDDQPPDQLEKLKKIYPSGERNGLSAADVRRIDAFRRQAIALADSAGRSAGDRPRRAR